MDELASAFENAGIGKEITLTVQRDGRSRNVKLRVADISQLNQN